MLEIDKTLPNGLSLVVTIVNRGYGEKIAALFNQKGVTLNYIFLGRGTATSEILDYLGLGETEKDIVLSSVPVEQTQRALDMLNNEMDLQKKGHGIAFTLPIGSVGGANALKFMAGLLGNEGSAQ
jgi:hypothetical protein